MKNNLKVGALDVTALNIVPRFHDAAWAGPIANGFEYLSTVMLPKSDVLIFSDVNHVHGQTLEADMLAPERLARYASQGVTDIYLEEVEDVQYSIDQLASGRINREEFINAVTKLAQNQHVSEAEDKVMSGNLADIVLAGAKLQNPIRFHAAQMSNTQEQEEALDALNYKIFDARDQASAATQRFIDKLQELGVLKGDNRDESDIDFLYNQIFPEFDLGGYHISGEALSNKINFISADAFDALKTRFGEAIPYEVLDKVTRDMYDFNEIQVQAVLDSGALICQYRIDNDELLVQKIMDTKAPEGARHSFAWRRAWCRA